MEENNEVKVNVDTDKIHNSGARNVFLFLGFLVLLFGIWMFISYKQTHFDYNGVNFQKVKEIAPYRTSLKLSYSPGITGNAVKNVEYSLYIRNDPRKLDEIPFIGDLSFRTPLLLSSKEDFNCNGDGIIGVQNLALLYQALAIKVMKSTNQSCLNDSESMFLKIESGNETKIEQISESCYVMTVSNCEILKATERFITETLVEVKNQTR